MSADFSQAMLAATSGMKAQTQRLKIVAQNIANADTTATAPGLDPYRRQMTTFKSYVDKANGVTVVKNPKVIYDQSDFTLRYDPQHPAADASGYVQRPNVNPLIETVDLQAASHSYEAALSAYDMSRNMQNRTIDLLKS